MESSALPAQAAIPKATAGLDELQPLASSDLLAGVLNSSHDGIMAFNSQRDTTGRIVEFEWIVVNPAAAQILGRNSDELLGRGLLELMPANATSGLFDRYVDVVETGRALTTEHHSDQDGMDRWFSTTAVRLNDGFAVTLREVTDEKQAYAALAHQKFHDALTGLPNGTLLGDRIAHALQGLGRRSGHVGIVAVEVEPLDRVSEVLGHTATSQMLTEVARRLQHTTRAGDTVARVDGHLFVVLCPHLDHPGEAQPVAQRLAAAFSDPITIGEHKIDASAHIGVATTDTSSTEPDSMIRNADTAAHRTRITGRGRSHGMTTIDYFDDELRGAATDRLAREVELRQAIAQGQLEVHYQTVHHAQTHGIVGVEALVRWQHPTKGLLTPAFFVPEAEELGLIVQLGDLVRRTALTHLRSWIETLGVYDVPGLSVNASATELAMPDYAERVIAALENADIAAHHLCVEVTETSLINDPIIAGATLRALADHGVKIALDDFGTGYSALDFLRRFPVDYVKIDKSFTANIGHDLTDRTIVTAILDLARSLGKVTVAEGIETSDQLEIVTGLGADHIQGHHFSKPLPYDQVTAQLTQRRCGAAEATRVG